MRCAKHFGRPNSFARVASVAGGVAFVVILAALAAIETETVTLTGIAPSVEGFLDFAPGGQAERFVLAIIAGAGFASCGRISRRPSGVVGSCRRARAVVRTCLSFTPSPH